MKFRLRSYELSPPGGYPYEQRKGVQRKFPSLPMIEAQAAVVADFRRANGLPRASVMEALEDIDRYTCARLGGMSQWCLPVDQEAQSAVALGISSPIVSPCRGCGAAVFT